MKPTFSRGDIIYYRPIPSSEALLEKLEEGTIVSFRLNDQAVVSHRISQLYPDGSFETTGDNNTVSDKNKVLPTSVLGLVQPIVVPRLGFFVDFINLHLIPCLIFSALVFIFELLFRNYSFQAGDPKEKRHDQISSFPTSRV